MSECGCVPRKLGLQNRGRARFGPQVAPGPGFQAAASSALIVSPGTEFHEEQTGWHPEASELTARPGKEPQRDVLPSRLLFLPGLLDGEE